MVGSLSNQPPKLGPPKLPQGYNKRQFCCSHHRNSMGFRISVPETWEKTKYIFLIIHNTTGKQSFSVRSNWSRARMTEMKEASPPCSCTIRDLILLVIVKGKRKTWRITYVSFTALAQNNEPFSPHKRLTG